MCGRFGLWAEPRQIEPHFHVQLRLPLGPRYIISLGQEILAVGQTEAGLCKAAWLHWGLGPHWSKEPDQVQDEVRIGVRDDGSRAELMELKFRGSMRHSVANPQLRMEKLNGPCLLSASLGHFMVLVLCLWPAFPGHRF
ncbi:MAG: SOS response-associated peptidase family protein [Desulfovermiculus sp.]